MPKNESKGKLARKSRVAQAAGLPQKPAPQTRVNIPSMFRQEHPNSCWAASMRMLGKHYGIATPETDKEMNQRVYGGGPIKCQDIETALRWYRMTDGSKDPDGLADATERITEIGKKRPMVAVVTAKKLAQKKHQRRALCVDHRKHDYKRRAHVGGRRSRRWRIALHPR